MIDEEATFAKFGYYSADLKPKSGKKIVAICDECEKARELQKYNYHTLCKSCAFKGKRSHNYGKHPSEKTRKKLSDTRKGERNHNYGKHLSEETRRKISIARSDVSGGEWNNLWVGAHILRKCQRCGNPFYTWASRIKIGKGLFCSRSCATKARMHNAPPQKTQPELIFERICKKHNLPFRFVGDGKIWLGNANPDFIHDTRKLVCEIYGDYWHSPLLNRNMRPDMSLDHRRAQLKAEGYKLIVLWESDLKREDAEQFVLYTLEKHNIFPSTT